MYELQFGIEKVDLFDKWSKSKKIDNHFNWIL